MKSIFRPAQGLLVCVSVLVSLGGCATITRGTTQPFSVNSTPVGATVSLSNGERCTTPCNMTLKRKHPIAVEICKVGYAPVATDILSAISGAGGAAMAGNVLVGGVIGAGIDAGSGAMRDLRPNPLDVTLVEAAPGCVMPSFPLVPKGGQTPDVYAKQAKKKTAAILEREAAARSTGSAAPVAVPMGNDKE